MGWIHGNEDGGGSSSTYLTPRQLAGAALHRAEYQILKAITALRIAPTDVSEACGDAEWDEDNGHGDMSPAHRAEMSAWHEADMASRVKAEADFSASAEAPALLVAVEAARAALAEIEDAEKAIADAESARLETLRGGWVICSSRDAAARAAAALQIPRYSGNVSRAVEVMSITVTEADSLTSPKNKDRFVPEKAGVYDASQIKDIGFQRELDAVLARI